MSSDNPKWEAHATPHERAALIQYTYLVDIGQTALSALRRKIRNRCYQRARRAASKDAT